MESTYHCAFCRGVTPRFVVAGENPQMTAANKFFVIKTEDRIVCVQEIGVEHNLHAIVMVIEKLHPSDMAENRIIVIISHIVRSDWRKSVPFQSQDTTLQKNVVFFSQEFVWTRQCAVFSVRR